MDAQLKNLVSARKIYKSKLTLLNKFVNAFDSDTDIRAFKKRVKANENLFDNFDKIQSQIEALDLDEEQTQAQLNERESFEETYFSLMATAEKHIANVEEPSQPAASSCTSVSPATDPAPRLPVINLPTFDGNLSHWIRFRDTFVSLVHNSDKLTDIDRFNYLTSTLKGNAARMIESLGVSESNYQLAWSRLKERFEDPKALIHHHTNALLEISPIKGQNGEALSKFIDVAINHVNALESLMNSAEMWDALISLHLAKRIDSATLDEWERRTMELTSRPTFREFSKFIEQRAQYLIRRQAENSRSGIACTTGQIKQRDNRQRHVASVHLANTKYACSLCKGDHPLQNCAKLLAMPLSERHETVKRLRNCFNCLQLGHSIKNCTRGSCRKCGKKHHTLLHKDVPDTGVDSPSTSQNTAQSHVIQTCVSNSESMGMEYTVLSTAVVYVEDSNGNRQKCRALLDVGSQANFVTEEFCNRLNLSRTAINTTVGGLGRAANQIQSRTQISMTSKCNNFQTNISCLVIKNITEKMPSVPLNKKHILIPAGVTPADPEFHCPNRIDLLIGAGLFWKLLCIGQHKLDSGNLIWQKTRLGWVLGGALNCFNNPNQIGIACHVITNVELDKSLTRFWEIEEGSSFQSAVSKSHANECETHFRNNVIRDKDGRYTVAIPFNDQVQNLGESRSQAEKRFLNIESKFRRNPDLKGQYVAFMREYEALNHMSVVDPEKLNEFEPCYYLPHHAVFKSSSTTTKIRVVFDGSARTSSGLSLNDVQLVGPTIQDDLISILIRFRRHRIVLSADIEKMYRQVRVRESDRKYQRILWRTSENEPIKTYNLNTVTYGTAAASFLATRALKQVGEDYSCSFPRVNQIISNDFYVDDLLTGCESLEHAIEIRDSLTWVLEQAGFPLRKWASNEPGLTDHDQDNTNSQVKFNTASKDPKTLGLVWTTISDELRYSIEDRRAYKITKRQILSEIAQIFDPLGLIAPVIVKAKLFMQQLWQLRVGWDEGLPQDVHTQWCNFRDEIRDITSFIIPRRVVGNNLEVIELHGFSDASERAYGAVIYLRTQTGNGTWLSRLLYAKSRVAPLKTISLPRLELCGALLLARISRKVKDALNITLTCEFYWTDSTITLAWIKGEPCRWKTFVANRVSEIQLLTSADQWRHVISNDNPADLISRGASPSFIRNNDLWWYGPPWLLRERHEWSPSEPIVETILESRRANLANLVVADTSAEDTFDLLSRYSSYSKLLRVTAYCLRFASSARNQSRTNNNSKERQNSPLTVTELVRAERTLVRIVQRIHFAKELEYLRENKTVHRNSRLAGLNPFIDEHGLIRVGERLANASINFDQKHPMILSTSHPLTTLVVRNEHVRLLHAGCQRVLASLRNKFWIISGRRTVRKIVRQCMNCFRASPVSSTYRMGNLPDERVTPTRAFSTCGVDYAGPLLTQERGRGRVPRKIYVCLFVCFITKAIHIELATDLSTDAFLNCLHRFISRRGRCHSIHSDNGKNLIGARNQFNELGILLNSPNHKSRVQRVLAQEGIEWHLIPPYAPHFGGL